MEHIFKRDKNGRFIKGNISFNFGKNLSNKHKLKIGESNSIRIKEYYKSHKPTIKQLEWRNKNHHTIESRKKISSGLKTAYKLGKRIPIKMYGGNNPFYGKKHTEENIEKIKKANIGKKFSKERLEKMRIVQLGEKGSNWKGGITPLNKILRQNSKWRIWRELVFLRDNFTCQNPNCSFCNNKLGINLHPHHIKPLSIFPELVFDVNNGITYCSEFHLKSGLHKELNLIKENKNVA